MGHHNPLVVGPSAQHDPPTVHRGSLTVYRGASRPLMVRQPTTSPSRSISPLTVHLALHYVMQTMTHNAQGSSWYIFTPLYVDCVRAVHCSTWLSTERGAAATVAQGLYRRAQALFGLADHEEAEADLKKLLEHEPNNRDARDLLKKVSISSVHLPSLTHSPSHLPCHSPAYSRACLLTHSPSRPPYHSPAHLCA
eukprot:9503890-Pyramimonas_sp.AAC.1